MKRIMTFCVISLTLITNLLVNNVFETKDREDLTNLDQTTYSQRIYLNEVNLTTDEHVEFLEEVNVSIIKNDTKDGIITKSLILNPETFPYEDFFLDNTRDFSISDFTFTNYSTNDKKADLPSFSTKNKLKIQSLNNYFSDFLNSPIGIYTIVSKDPFEKDLIIDDLSQKYNVPTTELITPKTVYASGYITNTVITAATVFIAVLILMFAVGIYMPILRTQEFGVKKLNGFGNFKILWDSMSKDFYILLICCLLINAYNYITKGRYPTNYWSIQILAQYIVIFLYFLQNIIAYININKLKVNNMLRKELPFKASTWAQYGLKIITLALLGFGVIQSSNVRATIKDYQEQAKGWLEFEDRIIIDYFKLSDSGRNKFRLGDLFQNESAYDLYKKAEAEMDVYYIRYRNFKKEQDFPQLPKISKNYNLLSTNTNYLKYLIDNKNLKLESEINMSTAYETFIAPSSYKDNEDELLSDIHEILTKGLTTMKEKESGLHDKFEIKLIYYDEPISLYNFDSEQEYARMVDNPIIHVFDASNMMEFYKYSMTATDLSNPLIFPGDEENVEKLKNIMDTNPYREDITYTLIRVSDYFQETIEAINKNLDSSKMISILLTCLSLFSSILIFLAVSKINWSKLAVQRLLGFGVFARHKGEFIALIVIYLIMLVVMAFIKPQLDVILPTALLFVVDILVMFFGISWQQRQSLANIIKGG